MKIKNVKVGTRVQIKETADCTTILRGQFGTITNCKVFEIDVNIDDIGIRSGWCSEELRLESKPKKPKEDPKIYTFKEILKTSGVYSPIDGLLTGCKIIIELEGDNLFVSGDGTHVCTLNDVSWVDNKFVKTNLDYKVKFKEIE